MDNSNERDRRTMFRRDSDLEEYFREKFAKVKKQFDAVLVGADKLFDWIAHAVLAENHMLLVSAPGEGKTLAARTFARATGLTSSYYQFKPDDMPSGILGYVKAKAPGDESMPEVHRGPIFANLLVADEINRASAKVKSAMLSAMQERIVTLEGYPEPIQMDRPFIILATMNPLEANKEVHRLGRAELDRYGMQVDLPLLSEEEVSRIAVRDAERNLRSVTPEMSKEDILRAIAYVRALAFSDATHTHSADEREIVRYAARLWNKSHHASDDSDRKKQRVKGVSQRAINSLMLLLAAHQVLKGLDETTPRHVQELARVVLGHRVIAEDDEEAQMILERTLSDTPIVPYPMKEGADG